LTTDRVIFSTLRGRFAVCDEAVEAACEGGPDPAAVERDDLAVPLLALPFGRHLLRDQVMAVARKRRARAQRARQQAMILHGYLRWG
jgi:hypothetical protein